MYKKFTKAVQNTLYALFNDFNKHFLEIDPTFSNPTRIFTLNYSNTFASEVKEFQFTQQKELMDYLDTVKDDQKSDKFGCIAAVNNLESIELKEKNARFVFHFCLGVDECKVESSSASEIEANLREKDLKYEIIFFNNQLNDDLFTKIQEIIEVDVNIINIE